MATSFIKSILIDDNDKKVVSLIQNIMLLVKRAFFIATFSISSKGVLFTYPSILLVVTALKYGILQSV